MVNIGLCHWTSRLSQQHATNVIDTFDTLLSRVVENPSKRIGDFNALSGRDQAQILQWNGQDPELVYECIHTSIGRQVAVRPMAPAIYSWDGQLTYLELDVLAGRLAQHLISIGVGPEVIVPLCFEKSVFVLISMVAVLKTGGAIAVLDPSNPIKRIQEILSQVQAEIVLASWSHADKFMSSVNRTLVVDQELLDNLPACSQPLINSANPDNAAYVISTSGSTGKPKIVVVPHAAFCSGAKGQATASGIGPGSRILQFASFAFDVSIMETFTSLIYGACVCMPSEVARSTKIADLINSLQITWAFLTPSVIKTINPEEVCGLKTLILGGEAVLQSNIEIWSENLQLMNGYGPSECSVAATVNPAITKNTNPANIGRAIGGRCWIVDAHDHNKLLPVGVIGELLVQGPILARGYLGDAEKTAATFIENPAWLGDDKWTRFYKTGDLVRYSSSGDIVFVGRKDTQVKVRGQRLELGEVEHNLSMSPHISHAIVFVPYKGLFKGQLIAALSLIDLGSTISGSEDGNSIELISSFDKETASSRILAISEFMSNNVPSYMVPTAWAVVRKFPFLPSGKLDRSGVKAWLENLDNATYRQILELEQESGDLSLSLTEEKLRGIWAAVLKTPAEDIGTRISFFALGGDSIMAMQVVARCRLENINLTIQDVHRFKTIFQLAASIESVSVSSSDSDSETLPDDFSSGVTTPFSLLPSDEEAEFIMGSSLDETAALCHISKDQIEDIYPCTPQQQEYMAVTARQEKAYTSRSIFRLPESLDLGRFEAAWERVAEANAILRTRIIPAGPSTSLQVVVREQISWQKSKSLDEYLKQDEQVSMIYGGQLVRFAIIDQGVYARFFVFTVHHATYDGWSIKALVGQVHQMYHEGSVPNPVPFQKFIQYLSGLDQEKAAAYWRSQLGGESPTSFPLLPSVTYQPRPNEMLRQFISVVRDSQSSVLISSLLRAAWAIVLAESSGSDDVVFVANLTGRGAPVLGIADIVAPTLTTVPVRIQLDPWQQVPDFLESVQTQATNMTPFEHTAYPEIRRLGLGDKHLFIIQPVTNEHETSSIFGSLVGPTHNKDFDPYALVMECNLANGGVSLEARYDGALFSTAQMQTLLQRFEGVISLLNKEQHDMSLGDVLRQTV